jgi:hypothetical protein
MPRATYSEDYGRTPFETIFPSVYSGGGLRERLSRAARGEWSSPEGDAMRQQLREAARNTIAPGYQRAAQSIRASYSQVARSSGYGQRVSQLWGGY